MINKKLLAVISIAATITTSSAALAKTAGNYVGVNVVNSDVDHQYNNGAAQFNEKKVGYGADYKYAINFNDNFFIAPGVFAEANNLRALNTSGDIIENDYRYGAKVDLGHDVTDNLAIYFTNGLSANHYKSTRVSVGNKSGTELGYFYGAGFMLNVAKDVALNLEYNTQKVRFDTANSVDLDSDLSVFKVGATYRF